MHIDLPQDVIDRVRQRTLEGEGLTEAGVIRRALDSLEWQEADRTTIQEGIDVMNEGRVRNFDEFDRDFRRSFGISDCD